jgi:hypothetical protein
MTGSDFEAALRKLVSGAARTQANVACIACDQCERCSESTFCVAWKGLARCHYCRGCSDCTDCAHCAGSTNLVRPYCVDGEGSTIATDGSTRASPSGTKRRAR